MHHSIIGTISLTLICLSFSSGSLFAQTREAAAILGKTRSASLQFPMTPKIPVIDEYHGVRVTDDYRWLEEANAPAVRRWTDEQNQFSRSFLEGVPERPAIEQRLKSLYSA